MTRSECPSRVRTPARGGVPRPVLDPKRTGFGRTKGARKPLEFPSRANSPRVGLRERPLAVRALCEAALFQRLQRKGYGSIADVSACRPDMLGDLGGRKGALLAETVSDRRADGLARLRLVACLRLAFWLWPRSRSCLPRG